MAGRYLDALAVVEGPPVAVDDDDEKADLTADKIEPPTPPLEGATVVLPNPTMLPDETGGACMGDDGS